jgi:hypothetical protein
MDLSIGADVRPPEPASGGPREVPSLEAPWEALERFGRALPGAAEGGQVRLTLEAVLEALGADAAFWQPGSGPEAFERVGPLVLSAGWCRAFTDHVRQEGDGGGVLVRSFLDPAAKPAAPWPCSAALVRFSRSAESWLAALSFHPRRLFAAIDGKVMLLARRMLLNHRQQAQVAAQWRAAAERKSWRRSFS